jgi:hypothetical protein
MTKDSAKPFVQRLYDSKTLDEKFSALEFEVCNAGFDAVLYTFIPRLSLLKESLQPVFQFSQAYTEIIENYQKNDFSENDFTIRLVEDGNLATIDWWNEAEKLALTKKEQHVIDVTKDEFNVSKGITFPTLSNDQGIAGVSMISFNKDYLHKKIDTKILEYLKICCRQYHDYTMVHQDARYKFILPILQALTPKKKIVLKHLISGQPMKNIANESDITTRYAEKLLVELRKDFGNISKNELIYFLGLLNITEYL